MASKTTGEPRERCSAVHGCHGDRPPKSDLVATANCPILHRGGYHTNESSNVTEATSLQQDQAFQNLNADLRGFIDRFAEGHRNLTGLISNQTEDLKKYIVAQNQETRDAISRSIVQRQAEGVSISLRETLLQSLRFDEMNERMNQIKPSYPGTYEWFFGNTESDDETSTDDVTDTISAINDTTTHSPPPEDIKARKYATTGPVWARFGRWLKCDMPLFYISGRPGSGKSTLTAFLLKHQSTRVLLSQSKGKAVHPLSYFFLISGTNLQNTIKGLLLTLLYQILNKDEALLLSLLGEPYNTFGDKQSTYDWPEDELRALLLHVLDISPTFVCIFVDGIDELSQTDGNFKLLQMIDDLCDVNGVKMCVSGRPEAIRQGFS